MHCLGSGCTCMASLQHRAIVTHHPPTDWLAQPRLECASLPCSVRTGALRCTQPRSGAARLSAFGCCLLPVRKRNRQTRCVQPTFRSEKRLLIFTHQEIDQFAVVLPLRFSLCTSRSRTGTRLCTSLSTPTSPGRSAPPAPQSTPETRHAQPLCVLILFVVPGTASREDLLCVAPEAALSLWAATSAQDGDTPLHLAWRNPNPDTARERVRALLQGGADPEATNDVRQHPSLTCRVHAPVTCYYCHTPVVPRRCPAAPSCCCRKGRGPGSAAAEEAAATTTRMTLICSRSTSLRAHRRRGCLGRSPSRKTCEENQQRWFLRCSFAAAHRRRAVACRSVLACV